jgi:MFS family permease
VSLSAKLPVATRPTRVRYVVVAALCLIAAIAYIQRNSYGGAEKQIREELQLTPLETGLAAGLFFFSYAVLQAPAGWAAQQAQVGSRGAVVACAIGFSVALALCALAADPYTLIGGRVLMGVFQAGLLPCATLIVAAWLPPSRRGLASGLLQSAMLIGGAFNNNLTGKLIGLIGWREPFLLYAVPGLVWALLFAVWFRNRPADHPRVNAAELAVIGGPPPEKPEPPALAVAAGDETRITAARPTGLQTGPNPAEESLTAPPADRQPSAPRLAGASPTKNSGVVQRAAVWAVLLSVPLYLICMQQFFRAGASRFVDLWLPTYLQEGPYFQQRPPLLVAANTVGLLASPGGQGPLLAASALSPQHIGPDLANQLASLPQWLAVVGSTLGGLLSDYLLKRTGSRRVARQGLSVVSILGGLALYLFAFTISNVTLAAVVFSAGFFVFYFSSSCAYAITLDMGGSNLGVVFGAMNMVGNFGAFAFTTLAPQLNRWFGGHWYGDDWTPTLMLFAAMHVAAMLFWLPINPNGVIGEPASDRAAGHWEKR